MKNCETCREQLAEHALGQGDPAQRAAIEKHLRACGACQAEFAEIMESWSLLPLALPAAVPPTALFERILSRLGEDERTASDDLAPTIQFTPSVRERVLSYLLAASVLIALTWGGVNYVRLVRDGVAPGEQAAVRSEEELARRLANLQQMERLLQADNVRLASLRKPQAPEEDVEAYVIWDLAAGQGHVYAFDLPPAPEGSVYQIWSSRGDDKLARGPVLNVNDDGLGSAIVDLPLTASPAAKAVVTLEPRGGSKTPTGKVVLEATF